VFETRRAFSDRHQLSMSARFVEEHMRLNHLLFAAVASCLLLAPIGFADVVPEAAEVGSPDPVAADDPQPLSPSEAAIELAPAPVEDLILDEQMASVAVSPEGDAAETEMSPVIEADQPIAVEIELDDVATARETSHGIVLGPKGVDDMGRAGRLHTVSSGDTLWDLSAAYLGTPWVWPSVWIDNDGIDNPHLIVPGDQIWITANEMRVVSAAEAEAFLEPLAMESEIDPIPMVDDDAMDSMEIAETTDSPAAHDASADDPSMLEAFPVAVPGQASDSMAPGWQVTISRRNAMGFVSADDLAGASTLVGSPVERINLAEGDPVVVGMGEGDVEMGDQFTIFQVVEEVRDVETNRILGHHVDVLGWLDIRELTGDTAMGEIQMSYSEILRGVRVMPRKMLSRRVTARNTPDAIEGKVVFLPSERTVMGEGGYVYLNRGEFHGVEIGSELEVFEPGVIVTERSRRVDVRTPDHSVADLVVVSVMEETSVAFVLSSKRELEVGDDVRPRIAQLASR